MGLLGHVHTSDRLSMPCALPASYEHHILLADVRIAIFQEEHLVNTIVLEGGKFGKEANWSSQALLNHQILLSTDLPKVRYAGALRASACEQKMVLLTPSNKYKRSFRALSLIWSVSNPVCGAMARSAVLHSSGCACHGVDDDGRQVDAPQAPHTSEMPKIIAFDDSTASRLRSYL